MIHAVFDANVIAAACGWRSEPFLCLVAVARRRVRSYVTDFITEEWRSTLANMEAEGVRFRRAPWPMLEWILQASRNVSPAPLAKPRSRDVKDDPYLACALAAEARFIVSRDPDLLALEKPFGVEIITPRTLLSRLRGG